LLERAYCLRRRLAWSVRDGDHGGWPTVERHAHGCPTLAGELVGAFGEAIG
jgi:hypothetical protein